MVRARSAQGSALNPIRARRGVASPSVTPSALSRRRLLATAAGLGAALAGAGLTGCSETSDHPGSTTAGTGPSVAPRLGGDDLAVARRTASSSTGLVELLQQSAGRHRLLRPVLAPLITRHQDHVRAFTPAGDRIRPSRRRGSIGGSPGATLRTLVEAEQRTAASVRAAAVAVDSGDLARALASAAACLAQHVQLLSEADADGRGRG